MKLTKRILCLVLAAVLLFALCACGKKQDTTIEDERSNNLPIPSDSTTDTTLKGTTTTTEDWIQMEGEEHFNDATMAW